MKGVEYLVPARLVWTHAMSTWHTEEEIGFDCINNDNSLALNN